ncbi:MAG: zinc metalloprotease HtpX [Candidatus Methanofastidiosa archaeon]|nr:zinc metalloprotease HtpX [Candidatus Methanofastidiosa archaeon]
MKTAILMGTLTALLMLAAGLLGLYIGGDPVPYLTIAFALALTINLVAYYKSDKIVLSMYRAKEVEEGDYPQLYQMVRELSGISGMPMPRIAIIPSQNPNAFATGRNENNAVVAVTEGALSLLDSGELRAVLAHELGHVLNRDMFISTMAAVIASIIGYLGQMGWWMSWGRRRNDNNAANMIGFILLLVFIPLASMMIRMAISRDREFGADRKGAEISGQPDMLANALIKLENASVRSPMRNGNQATSSLFIVNPFRSQSLMSLLSTHPPTIRRVEKLNEIAVGMGRPTVYLPQYR